MCDMETRSSTQQLRRELRLAAQARNRATDKGDYNQARLLAARANVLRTQLAQALKEEK